MLIDSLIVNFADHSGLAAFVLQSRRLAGPVRIVRPVPRQDANAGQNAAVMAKPAAAVAPARTAHVCPMTVNAVVVVSARTASV